MKDGTQLKIAQPEGAWFNAQEKFVLSDEQLRRRKGLFEVTDKKKDKNECTALQRVFFKIGEGILYGGPITPYIRKQCDMDAGKPNPKAKAPAPKKEDSK